MSTVNKVDRYDWVKPGDRGKPCRVSLDDLMIDYEYQRGEISKANTLAVARNFNWVSFNSIVVMERENGDKYVVDGQQRLLAAKHRGDIKDVPCIVFQSSGKEHEAKAFISLNINRRHVSAVDKFNAGVLAGTSPEKHIAEWLSGIGLKITKDCKDVNGICFPAKLIETWKMNSENCRLAVLLQREINGPDEPLYHRCHEGVWWLLQNGIDVAEYVDKIKILGGKPAIQRSINTVLIEANANGNKRFFAIGILRLINHKRKRKISIVGVDE